MRFKLVLLLFIASSWAEEILPLNGTWQLENDEKGYKNLIATVPGGIYSDLMSNNIIPDIFLGSNDVETRWVAETNWTYRTTFRVASNYLNHAYVNLVFDGVDTFATIKLNDVKVGITDNMFVKFTFDVKTLLKIGENTLSLEFVSPIEVARFSYENQLKNYLVPPECVPSNYNGECHVNEIRKMQSSFSWDWGPAFPSVGIWKKVYLRAHNNNLINDVTVETVLDEEKDIWTIILYSYFNLDSTKGKLQVDLNTDVENITNMFDLKCTKIEDGEMRCVNSFFIPTTYVKRWWPNGYGDAKLYQLNVTFISSDNSEMSKKYLKIGFRTLQLVQDKLSEGASFFFRVNDIPIFIKGSNMVPLSVLPEQTHNLTIIRFLLQSAKATHMNMLRIWGGGLYNSDAFYDIADELGIMIWQDFMFACSMYPTRSNYLRSVRTEVRQQIRRLQHHASIAVWAGNNENEAALSGNWYGTSGKSSLYRSDYVKLYVNVIMDEAGKLDPSRPFLISSPTNGIETIKDRYVAKNPYSPFYGDVHYYNYYSDGWNANYYPITRFCSEYGLQSMPSTETILTATNSLKDLCLSSNFFQHRQHLPGGNYILDSLVEQQFPRNGSSCTDFIYHSQIYQAVAIKVQTEFYRQWRSRLDDAGRGLTMGAMYWQFNDVWVAPTWAGIDAQFRWKMLHYYAKRFFAPIIVTGFITVTKQLDLYVVCDLPHVNQSDSLQLHVGLYSWNSLTAVHEDVIPTTLLPVASRNVKSYANVEQYVKLATNGKCTPDSCFMHLKLANGDGDLVAPENFIFLNSLKDSMLSSANVKIALVEKYGEGERTFKIIVSTDNVALFVWLNAKELRGQFSENGFLQVTPTKEIFFEAEVDVEVDDLRRVLTLKHLQR